MQPRPAIVACVLALMLAPTPLAASASAPTLFDHWMDQIEALLGHEAPETVEVTTYVADGLGGVVERTRVVEVREFLAPFDVLGAPTPPGVTDNGFAARPATSGGYCSGVAVGVFSATPVTIVNAGVPTGTASTCPWGAPSSAGAIVEVTANYGGAAVADQWANSPDGSVISASGGRITGADVSIYTANYGWFRHHIVMANRGVLSTS